MCAGVPGPRKDSPRDESQTRVPSATQPHQTSWVTPRALVWQVLAKWDCCASSPGALALGLSRAGQSASLGSCPGWLGLTCRCWGQSPGGWGPCPVGAALAMALLRLDFQSCFCSGTYPGGVPLPFNKLGLAPGAEGALCCVSETLLSGLQMRRPSLGSCPCFNACALHLRSQSRRQILASKRPSPSLGPHPVASGLGSCHLCDVPLDWVTWSWMAPPLDSQQDTVHVCPMSLACGLGLPRGRYVCCLELSGCC